MARVSDGSEPPTRREDWKDAIEALAAHDAGRPVTAAIVEENRRGGPERVIDVVEERAPEGFASLEQVISRSELETITRGYATVAGFAPPAVEISSCGSSSR